MKTKEDENTEQHKINKKAVISAFGTWLGTMGSIYFYTNAVLTFLGVNKIYEEPQDDVHHSHSLALLLINLGIPCTIAAISCGAIYYAIDGKPNNDDEELVLAGIDGPSEEF